MMDKNSSKYKIAEKEINAPLSQFRQSELVFRQAMGFIGLPEYIKSDIPIRDLENRTELFKNSAFEINAETSLKKLKSESELNQPLSQISTEKKIQRTQKNDENNQNTNQDSSENRHNKIEQSKSDLSQVNYKKNNHEHVMKAPIIEKIDPLFSYHPYIEAIKLLNSSVLPSSVFNNTLVGEQQGKTSFKIPDIENKKLNTKNNTHLNNNLYHKDINEYHKQEAQNINHLSEEKVYLKHEKLNTENNTHLKNDLYHKDISEHHKQEIKKNQHLNNIEKNITQEYHTFYNKISESPLFGWPLSKRTKRENFGNSPFAVSEKEGREQGVTLDGYRQTGGNVSAGGTYLVGEKGPEILSMGDTSGTIIPNNSAGGPTGKSFSVNIENLNISTSKNKTKEDIVSEVKGALEELAKNDFRAEMGLL